jgi:SAM-dependent methyltransferase
VNPEPKDDRRRAWDAIWIGQFDSIWERFLQPIRIMIMAPAILRAVPPEALASPIGEIGAGRAATSFVLAKRIPGCVIALDLAMITTRRVLEESRGRIAGVTASAEAIPFRDRALGLAFNVSTLEHFPDPRPVLKEMGRSARFVSAAVPAASRTWQLLLGAMNFFGYEGTGDFYRLYEEELLRSHFTEAGLRLIALRKVRLLFLFPFWVATARAGVDAA